VETDLINYFKIKYSIIYFKLNNFKVLNLVVKNLGSVYQCSVFIHPLAKSSKLFPCNTKHFHFVAKANKSNQAHNREKMLGKIDRN